MLHTESFLLQNLESSYRSLNAGKVCIRAKWSVRAGAFPRFFSIK